MGSWQGRALALPTRPGPLRRPPVTSGPRYPLLLVLVLVGPPLLLVVLQVRWQDQLARAQGVASERLLQQGVERIAAGLDLALAERSADGPPSEEDLAALARGQLAPLATGALGPDAPATHAFAIEPAGGGPSLFATHPGPARAPDAKAEVFTPRARWVGFRPEPGAQDEVGPLAMSAEGEQLAFSLQPPVRWHLVARALEGSPAALAARARTRNLALGAGVLALVVAGAGMFLVAERRARRLAQERLAFVAGVSHELRTPLSVLRTAGANLRDGLVREPDALVAYGALVEGEARRLGALVERVLRSSSGAVATPAARAAVPVNELVDEAVARCAHLHARRRYTVATELAPDLPPLHGERDALAAALENLVENAIRYGPDGQTIRVRARRANGARLALEVEDEGPGLAPDERERVFAPFVRGSAARAARATGSGLGLDVVARVAAAHGGRAYAADAARGARLVLELPLEPPAAEEAG